MRGNGKSGGGERNAGSETRVAKKLLPESPGTARYVRQFGKALVCVRYRNDEAAGKRYTTVEVVVDEKDLPATDRRLARQRMAGIKVACGEADLRRMVKEAGGQWDAGARLWRLPYRAAVGLGLAGRIVSPGNSTDA